MLQSLGLLFLLVLCTHDSSANELLKKLRLVSTNSRYVWGLTEKNEVFSCEIPCKDWKEIGYYEMEQLDIDEENAWAVSSLGFVYKHPVDGSGDWDLVAYITSDPGIIRHVSASGNGWLWAINENKDIYKCKKPCEGLWRQVPGKLKQLDGGQSSVYGVADDRTIWQRPIDGTGEWREVDGELDSITVSPTSDHIFGIAASGSVWHCTEPCYGSWTRMAGKLNQCDVTGNHLFGVTHGNNDDVQYYLWSL